MTALIRVENSISQLNSYDIYESDLQFIYEYIQCESKKISPLRFSDIFSQTVGNL